MRPSSRRATGALADFNQVPAPRPSTPLSELPILAVDVETSGLDASKDALLSIGWVPLNGRRIDLAGATEIVLTQRPEDAAASSASGESAVGESATVHGITDDEVAGGAAPGRALEKLLQAMAGRVMLVHFAPMERDFLGAACQREFSGPLNVPVIDTLELERRRMEVQGKIPRGEDLRLPRVRERYGLPTYRSHRAVTDALACAELYLALTAPDGMSRQYKTLRSVTD
ncbi:MAG TPA: 3'-5' exonuclease [Candidatus Corynebacterium avicola]|uniref:3'-5' exonuclease n=1 Tax=Candidatus Corynebacterium avicola TaxID=2838527 RepID=A0A9D1RMV2_9CORY|nr:3'-5' exonuclease [Candidatus Corynebacterium avicola]